MAGGTWTTQNKVRPGFYLRFSSSAGLGLSVGSRGVVAIAEPLSWGPVSQVTTIEPTTDTTPICGYPITDPNVQFLQEIFKGSDRTAAPVKVLLYRPAADSAVQATATTGVLTATALYPGTRGNDISLVITENVDDETFTVQTLVDGAIVDTQTGAQVSDLVANEWVTFSGTGALAATTGVALQSGSNGTVQAAAYSTFLTAIEPYDFDILIYDGTDNTVQTAMQTFVERLANENGQYSQFVTANMTTPDSRFVINVASGVTLDDGTELTAQQVCWWVGGAEAGASYNEALTYAQYPGAVAVSPILTNNEVITALQAGQLVLTAENGGVAIEQDINSLTTFTPDLPKVYRKNRTIRLCNAIANDLYAQFAQSFIGAVNNNAEGRALFQAAIVGYLLQLQGAQAIQNFSAEDVEVLPGEESDAIVVNVALQTVDSTEKIYMTVQIQ